MPKPRVKTKEHRWEVLDGLLAKGTPMSQHEIFDAYQTAGLVSKVDSGFLYSFQKDIAFFKEQFTKAGIPDMLVVERVNDGIDNRYRRYYYKVPGSKMEYITGGMTDSEYRNLVNAISKLRGMVCEETFEEIRFALQSRVEADYQKAPFVDYEDNRRLKGREYRPLFYKSIVGKQVLHIHYRTFKGTELEYDFHPYLLKQFNERWFAFGLGMDSGNMYTIIPLDRLEEAPVSVGTFTEECPEDYMTYFTQRVGVSNNLRENRAHHIVLSILDRETWGRIVTKPIHRSQEIVAAFNLKTQVGTISLDVVPNLELLARILSLGEGVVIEDTEDAKDFRELFIRTIKKISGHYPEK